MSIQTIYREHLSEPWFTLVSLGLKTCEGRLNNNRFRELKEGDIIQWFNHDFGERIRFTKITRIEVYRTFEEYLNDKGLKKCLPGMSKLKHGLEVYRKYYSKSDEEMYGVVAFELEKLDRNIKLFWVLIDLLCLIFICICISYSIIIYSIGISFFL